MTQSDFFSRKSAFSALGRLDGMCKCKCAEEEKSDRNYWINMEERENYPNLLSPFSASARNKGEKVKRFF